MKRKLTAADKRARRERRKQFMTIFVHGKQKRVPRPPLIEGLPVEEFISRNADPIWLHENEMWELLHEYEMQELLHEDEMREITLSDDNTEY